MTIALSGFMGCGKSTAARLMAAATGCFYFDLDDTIQLEEGRSVSDIVATDGLEAFRAKELSTLERILEDYDGWGEDMVISLGGGTPVQKRCMDILREAGVTVVYLRASVDTIMKHLAITGVENRPLLCGAGSLEERVKDLMQQRIPSYEASADIVIDVEPSDFDGSDPSAEGIVKKLAKVWNTEF